MRKLKKYLMPALWIAIALPLACLAEDTELTCTNAAAQKHLLKGFNLQKDDNTDGALAQYNACLLKEPKCVSCLYEIGWSYWKKGEWQEVIKTWQTALKIEPDHLK